MLLWERDVVSLLTKFVVRRHLFKKPKPSVLSVLVVVNSAFWKCWWEDDQLWPALYSRVLTDLEGRHNYFSWGKKNCQNLKTVSNLIGLYPSLKCLQSFNWSTDNPIALASFTKVAVRCSLSTLSIWDRAACEIPAFLATSFWLIFRWVRHAFNRFIFFLITRPVTSWVLGF